MGKHIPKDFPVRPLKPDENVVGRMTCNTCHRSWDDAIATAYTPTPSGRCPFEAFHPVNKNAEAWKQANEPATLRKTIVEWQEEVIWLQRKCESLQDVIDNQQAHIKMLQRMVASYQADNEKDYTEPQQ